MTRIAPGTHLKGLPSHVIALRCATGRNDITIDYDPEIHTLTLPKLDETIRAHVTVTTYEFFRQDDRILLKDLRLQDEAIILVRGHAVYANKDHYWSFFFDGNYPVVAIWHIKL